MRRNLVLFALSFFIFSSLVISHQPVLAATTTKTFTIKSGNLNDATDIHGNPILKPEKMQGSNVLILNASLNNRTA